MKRLGLILLTMLLCCNVMARQERDTLGVGTLVSFVENRGQWEHPFLFEAQLHNAALFLESGSITVVLRTPSSHPAPPAGCLRQHAYRMHFDGCNANTPTGFGLQPTYNNYMLGTDVSTWQSHVPLYDAVRYDDLYDNIDFEIYGGSLALKYNFIVHPNGNPSQIAIEYEGTDGMEVTSSGCLRIRTSVRDIIELKPYVYQTNDNDEQEEVTSRWRVSRTKKGLYRATIEVGDYDHRRDLVIDPVLIFSTYTGSTADNWGTTATYDSRKNVYTAGLVFDVGYPVSLGAYDTTFNGGYTSDYNLGIADIGIFKFDSTGTQRLFATYLGGNQADMAHSMFVNSFDELLVFGTTGSQNFPVTPGAYQTTHAGGSSLSYEDAYNQRTIYFPQGSDIFVSRLSSDGSQLLASTYVGGSGNDGLNYHIRYNNSQQIIMGGNDSLYFNYGDGARGEIITDDLNNVYIGSTTFSSNFPVTAGCVQPQAGGRQDGVVFKLDHNLRNMLWSTYIGGSHDDAVYSIDVDSAYNLLLCGGTNSSNFPVTDGTFQTSYGGGSADGFVSKISYHGNRLIASSYVGDLQYDQLYFVRTGRHDEVFLFGQTRYASTRFIYNAGYNVPGAGMLLMRLSPDLATRRWSTVFGTPNRINLSPTAFAADICNRIYAVGWGRNFVPYIASWYTSGTSGMEHTNDAYQDSTDGQDFYIISLDANANQLEYASFFGQLHDPAVSSHNGADHVDGGTSRFDRMATLYQSVCASCGGSQNFPTTAGAWSRTNRSNNCNNALFRFSVSEDFPVAEFILPPAGCAPYTLPLTNTGRGTAFHWDFGDGTSSTDRNPSHTYASPGTYTITLVATMPSGCSVADTQRHTVQVLGDTTLSHTPEISCSHDRIQIGVTPALGVTYNWSGDPVSDATVANPWVDTTGTYILHTSATGCTQTDTFHVRTYSLVDSWQPQAISCHDSVDGRALFRIGVEVDPDSLTVSVIPPHPVSPFYTSEGRTFFSLDSLAPGVSYTVSVTGHGCSYEQEVLLTNPDLPPYTKEFSASLCDDSCSGWIAIHYNLSAIPEVQPLDTLIENLCPGTYITHLTTSQGCPLTDTSVITRDNTLDNLSVWADRYEMYLGESVQLHASDGAASYLWAPDADLDRPDLQHPTATPSDTAACYYVVATAASGCSRSDTLCLHCTDIICGAPEFVVPNAFTPNGDGINDRLCFNADILTEFHIAIFNRWGQCVYESDDATQCWDGIFRNTPALAGVYTYTCHIRCHNGVENDFKGDITLIR
ncbi:MAG: gliding motility-associated C-terminal domain-containing protein [Bacteroidales bacterium]|nr:gliding motility-associated C-terminal domain-containing protein [Bacteroidales bacterium]